MDISPETPPQDVREDPVRVRGLVPTHFRIADCGEFSAVIHNVSHGGLCASTSERILAVGTRLFVALPSGQEQSGNVQWVRDRKFGVKFDEVLAKDSLQALQEFRTTTAKQGQWEVSRMHLVQPLPPAIETLRRV